MTRRRAIVVLAAVLLLLPALHITGPWRHLSRPVHAQAPATAPDIQRIMDKIAAGGQATADEIQKLQDWTLRLMQQANEPNTVGTQFGPPGTPANASSGIPARVSITGSWRKRQTLEAGASVIEEGRVDLAADVLVYASINGTDDYYASLLNPSASASSFRFEPRAVGGRPVPTGSGSMMQKRILTGTSPFGRVVQETTTAGDFEQTAVSLLLTTTGSDNLFASGGAGGAIRGERIVDDNGDHQQYAAAPDAYTGGSDPGIPFAAEHFAAESRGRQQQLPRASDVAMHLSYRALTRAMQAGKPTTVSGTETFAFTDSRGYDVSGMGTIRITFGASGPSDLLIVPDDESAWRRWLPLPWTDNAEEARIYNVQVDDPSVAMTFDVGFRNRAKTCRLDIDLRDVEELKGTSTNYPTDASDTHKTLRLIPNQSGLDVDAGGMHARTTRAVASVKVKVAATDSAGWGRVHASCEAQSIEATDPATGKFYVMLPRDDNEDHVADQFAEDHADGRDPRWDGDPVPGGQRSSGDGYSLYEEYRGFVVLKKAQSEEKTFIRTDPQAKDIFVYDRDRLFSEYYEPNNATAAQLVLHYVDPTLMRYDKDTEQRNRVVPAVDHRRVNVNTPDYLRERYQVGVAVLRDDTYYVAGGAITPSNLGTTLAEWSWAFQHGMSVFYQIRINTTILRRNFIGLLARAGYTPSEAELNQSVKMDLENTLVHEFGHQIGITHHLPRPGAEYPIAEFDAKGNKIDPNAVHAPAEDWGPLECTMRYPVLGLDIALLKAGHWRSMVHYCVEGEIGRYPKGYAEEEGMRVTTQPCWPQIDVRKDLQP